MSTYYGPNSILSTLHRFFSFNFQNDSIVTFASQTRKLKQREIIFQGYKLRDAEGGVKVGERSRRNRDMVLQAEGMACANPWR